MGGSEPVRPRLGREARLHGGVPAARRSTRPEQAGSTQLKQRCREATEGYLELPRREVVRAKLVAIDAEMAGMEERLRPLDQKLGDLRGAGGGPDPRARPAREACGEGDRQKAQALAGVLARIVCHFEHFQTVPKKRQTAGQKRSEKGMDRSRLERVVFEPIVGRPTSAQRNRGEPEVVIGELDGPVGTPWPT